MDMVWHNDEGVHMHLASVLKQTMIENERSGFFGKNELPACAEANMVCRSRLLHVREISAIEGRHSLERILPEGNREAH